MFVIVLESYDNNDKKSNIIGRNHKIKKDYNNTNKIKEINYFLFKIAKT